MFVAVDDAAGSQLGEEELQQMLGRTVEHLRDLAPPAMKIDDQ